jgi:hypothetical protein
MQQLCRMFCTIIEETIRDIEQFKVGTLSWAKRDPTWDRNWVERFEHEFKALETEWDEYTADQITKLNAVLPLIQKKREEVESLRDGVSSSIRIMPN